MAAQAALLAGRIERKLAPALPSRSVVLRQALERETGTDRCAQGVDLSSTASSFASGKIDAEFKALSRLTQLTHHDLFTWGLTHFTDWDPGISTELEAAIEADPDDRHSRLALANLLFDQPEMENRVQKILEPLPPGDPDAAALRIELNLVHGRIEEANALLEQAPRGHPRLARLRGRAALSRHDPAAAIGHFREALSGQPCDRVAISELGKALVLLGDGPAARDVPGEGSPARRRVQPDQPREQAGPRKPAPRPHPAGQGLRGGRALARRRRVGTSWRSGANRSTPKPSRGCGGCATARVSKGSRSEPATVRPG